MRSSILLLAACLTLPVTAGAALAPSETGRAAFSRFKALDSDRDRALSPQELLAKGRESAADALFALMDRDGDGKLAVKEMEAADGGGRLARFQAYDVNRDGMVVRREFPAFWDPRLFTALDGDGDGRLALAELRPEFAGWRASPREAPVVAARARPAPRDDRPWCWVPNFGVDADRWLIEVPVASADRCRTLGR